MPDEAVPNPATDHAAERPGGLRGPYVLLLTLGIILAVPLVTYAVWRATQIDLGEPDPLDWSQRAQWPMVHTQGASLERGPMSSARTNQQYFEIASPIDEAEETAVWRCVQLARQDTDAFTTGATIDELRAIIDQHPEQFYPRYLLSRATGDEPSMAAAIERSPRVLVIPVTDAQGRPAKDQVIGDVTIAMVRVADDQIDESLLLHYPRLTTDQLGRAYLPVYAGIYRVTDAKPRDTISPTRIPEGYFTFPGQVGRLPAWVVMNDNQTEPAQAAP
jgi:hypothetical protein